MPEALQELVRFRADKLFNGAVNIDWFGTDEQRASAASEAYVFHGPQYHGVSQADVGVEHGHRLVDTATFALSIIRRSYGIEDQPFTLAIAGYGTGKSHLALSLASLLSDPDSQVARGVLSAIEAADKAIGAEIRAILHEANRPCLVVALNGMKSFDLTTEITRQIIRQLTRRSIETRALDELRPRFSQAATLIRMGNDEIKQEVLAACTKNGIEEILAALEQQDELIYSYVHKVFSSRGMALTALRGEPKLTIVPLSVDEVARFWASFRTARDLAIVGLMLMHGLRSGEVLALNPEDVLLSEGQLRVRGKGSKLRFLPLAPETTQLIDHYLRLERPDPCSAALFVVLKGPARGQRMTPAGLRSLFRHHRQTTGIQLANPHRFRHTFASDMVRAGISLPALMQLMGHADIQTTLHYVQVSPQDVYLQYARAAAQCIRPQSRIS